MYRGTPAQAIALTPAACVRITTQVYEHLLHDGLLDDALDVFHSATVAERVSMVQPKAAA